MGEFARGAQTLGHHPLRSLGPKVFISYSFQDTQLAQQLRDALTKGGFQVRMEDETSLLGYRLPDILASRIADAECFIQLRTSAANRSRWVGEEFKLAEARRLTAEHFIVLPVVFDRATLDDRTADWAFLDASAGLTDRVLATTKEMALKSISRILIDRETPSSLHTDSVVQALTGPPNRRILLDADGFWFDLLAEVLTAAAATPGNRSASFIEQEQARRKRLDWSFARMDAAARILLRQLRQCIQDGIIDRELASASFDSFYRIVFEQHFWLTVQNAEDLRAFSFTDDFSGLSRFGKGGTLQAEASAMEWALKPVLGHRLRFAHTLDIVKTGMDGTQCHSAYVYFPQAALGEDWQIVGNPEAIILLADWALFGLPQVAARAIGLTQRHNPDFATAAYQEIEKGMGWKLSSYHRMGLP